MGWNSWNAFTKNINEKLILETADAMADQGLIDAGYEYLVIDDCWSRRERDGDGNLSADPEKFPHGMKYVADYVHSKGLKFGMYSCCGVMTCQGYPGSFGHEFQDAEYFAGVGADLLKYDNCYKQDRMPNILSYARMSMALRSTGRPILFSACNWGREEVWTWARSVGAHMFRSTGDIDDTFESIRSISESQKSRLCYSAPGCFNDIDMLVTGLHGAGSVGFGKGCTDAQYRYHFALWCMFSAPLMLGCDVRNLSEENRKLITNRELISICRDEDARPPIFVRPINWTENNTICIKFLSDGSYAVGMFNVYDKTAAGVLPYFDIGLDPLCGRALDFTDVFTGEHLGVMKDYAKFDIPAGGCRVFRARLVRI